MQTKRILPVAIAALIVTGAAGGVAFAKERGEAGNDAAALANSKVTLQQAMGTAEQQTGGKAVGAGVDNENGTVSIAVEIASSQGVKTVLIDPQSGQVRATRNGGDGDNEEND